MIYVMSDIHGHMDRYDRMLDLLDLQPEDRMIVQGDVVDRGPDGIGILLDIMERPNFEMLLGNHEAMMLQVLAQGDMEWLWYYNGGIPTRMAYDRLPGREREAVLTFLQSLPVEKRVRAGGREFLLVHGSWLEEDGPEGAVWKRIEPDAVVPEGRTVVFGHTPTWQYQPDRPYGIWFGGDKIGIDCGLAGLRGDPGRDRNVRLGCLRLDDLREYYV
ncbi:metallophosphoesterase [Anaerotalea alkaliphila]|uniref:Calcineurin-like phosphoesterase domain-containing protein n=1 Tax=Anaerotalea alkaliphila TaxID=2662126 RepID=A0A7X5HVJ4_9FIRM|nr:metallophosphoesterase [Anaerotalea alkaliphila]NDL67445.1 hypothetical protein [Anaerotalea alkaliphila]